MKCPRCRAPLLVVEHDAVELDHCAACGGTWFDAGELALLFAGEAPDDRGDGPAPAESSGIEASPERIAALPDADTTEQPRRCPICRMRMRKVNIGPSRRVLIDACPRGHGLWFDDKEVAALATNVSAAAGELPRRVAAFLGEAVGDAAGRAAGATPETATDEATGRGADPVRPADHERKEGER